MKIIKRILSVVLITLQCGNTAFAEAPSPHQNYSDDGVLYTYNADGTIPATIYKTPVVEERKSTSREDERLEDHGDNYVNTSEDVTVTLEKTYSNGDVLVSLSDADTAIAFYPKTAAGVVPIKPSDPVEGEANEIMDRVSGDGLPDEDEPSERTELPDEKQSAGEDETAKQLKRIRKMKSHSLLRNRRCRFPLICQKKRRSRRMRMLKALSFKQILAKMVHLFLLCGIVRGLGYLR